MVKDSDQETQDTLVRWLYHMALPEFGAFLIDPISVLDMAMLDSALRYPHFAWAKGTRVPLPLTSGQEGNDRQLPEFTVGIFAR